MTHHLPLHRAAIRPALVALLALSTALSACDTTPSDPFAAAQAAYEDGSPRSAMEYVTAALEQHPDDTEVQMLAGDIAMALGNSERAVTQFQRIVDGSASSSLARAKLVEANVMANFMQAAEQALADLTYDVPLAYTAAIGFALAKGDLETASAKLSEGLARFPDDPRLITIDAQRLLENGDAQGASERLAPILAVKPIVSQAHRVAGRMAMDERDLQGAEGYFITVLKARPADQTAMLALAAIARDRGDDAEAANWINKANQTGTPNPVGMLFAAQMAYDAGDIDRAFELVEIIPEEIASQPNAQRLRGFVDAARGQYGTAIAPLQSYVDFAGEDYLARRILAQSYAEQGEFANGWKAIEPALNNPQSDTGTLVLALQLSKQTGLGSPDAIRTLIEKRKEVPKNAEEMLAAGAAIRAGDWAKADEIYAPLLKGASKDDPVLLNNAAVVKTKLGRHSEAVALARRAYAKAPQSAQILDTLGWALWQEGSNRDEARTLLARARDAAPGNPEIAEHWAATTQGT